MHKLLLTGTALIVAWSMAGTLAVAQPAKPAPSAAPRGIPSWSAAARTAACKADCLPQNTHGLYRFYGREDPTLMSVAGKKSYNDCVRICLAPLPVFYVQRSHLEQGGVWFGSNAADCLTCHVQGPNLKVPPGQRPMQQPANRRRGH